MALTPAFAPKEKIAQKWGNMKKARKGFTLIDVIVVLAVLGTLAGAMVPLFFYMVNKQREDQTIDELDSLRIAVAGNPVIVTNEARTQFGYVGDMGALPTKIEDLYKKGTQPTFSFDTVKKLGAGWNGPYIDPKIVEDLETLKTDDFGNDYEYTTAPFTDPAVGATVEGRIRSKGKDGAPGGNDDLSLEFFKSQLKSKVFGFIKDDLGDGAGGVAVTLNFPLNGILSSTSATTDEAGLYTFEDVSYGNRSLSLNPKLVLAAGSAKITGPQKNNIEFAVTNFSSSNIAITSFKAVYSADPPSFYKSLKIGTTTVYNSTTPRLGSGDIVTFAVITVAAGSGVTEAIPIRIQTPVTEVADINLSVMGRGSSIKIEMGSFEDAQTGGANPVNMSGVPMEITFSDGSVVRFTAF